MAFARIVTTLWGLQGLLALGWAVAAPACFEFRGRGAGAGFPLLWLTGEKGAGKTALLAQVVALWGPRLIDNASNVTANALVRDLGAFSGVSVPLDDLRPDAQQALGKILLGSSTGSSGKRASREDMLGTLSLPTRGCVAATSESTPHDIALANRALLLAVPKSEHADDDDGKRRIVNMLNDLVQLGPQAGHRLACLLTAEEGGQIRRLLELSREIDFQLGRAGFSDARQRGDVWAPTLAGIHLLFEMIGDEWAAPKCRDGHDSIAAALVQAATDAAKAADAQDWVAEWLDDLAAYFASERVAVEKMARVDLDVNVMWLNVSALAGEWLRERRTQGRPAFLNANDLRRYLRAKPFLHVPLDQAKENKLERTNVWIAGRTQSCYGLMLDHPKLPQSAKDLAEMIRSRD